MTRRPPALAAPTVRPPWLAMSCLVVLAAVLRVRALFTDFWFDEITSYEEFARRAHSVVDIFLSPAFKHDNNQHLNTLLLYVLGEHKSWEIYRLPAFAAGLVTVAVATWIGSRQNRTVGWIFGIFVASSFLMVVYTTEARGYAWLLLFGLLMFQALGRYLEAPSLRRAIPFWIWTALGLTAHSTVLHVYLGALLWSGYRLRGRAAEFLRLHTVPALLGAAWAAFVLWGSRVGGGPPWQWKDIADQSLAWTLGYPLSWIPGALAATAAAALVIWDARSLWREGSDEGLFTVGVILGPPVFIAALAPPWLFPRYFLISLLFLLLVLARSLGRLWQWPRWGLPSAVALVALFVIGNLRSIVPFSTYGHGLASQAVQDIVKANGPGLVTVAGEPVERQVALPIDYYAQLSGLTNRIEFVSQYAAQPALNPKVEWAVVTSQFPCASPASRITLPSVGTFDFRRAYPAYGPSGICWFVYRSSGVQAR